MMFSYTNTQQRKIVSDRNEILVSTRKPVHAVIEQTEHHQSTNRQRKNILRIDRHSLRRGRPCPQDCVFD